MQAGGDRLVAFMQQQGFALQRAPVLRFIRQAGEVYQVMTLESGSHGVHMNTRVYCWLPEVDQALYGYLSDAAVSEDFVQVNGGYLGADGMNGADIAWTVRGPDRSGCFAGVVCGH